MIAPLEGLPGWRHLALDAVGSTNTEAMQLGQSGDNGNLWITANQQLTGKARRGRGWVSDPGNLYASLLLVDPAPADALVTLPLVASLALHEALVSVEPELNERLEIKWPNDLLLDGKKLSGILLESGFSTATQKPVVVIGIGVNCQHSPDNPLYPATSLAETGFPLTADQVFLALVSTLSSKLENWNRGTNFANARAEWLDRAHGIGKPITARFPDHEIDGHFVDIDPNGYLLLEDKLKTIHKISAADIFFGESQTKST